MANQRDDIVRALDKILEYKSFANSKKAKSFLSYVVIEHLEGRRDQLTETSIAQDVFGKGAEFESAIDSTVRVTANRVRKMLQLYYASDASESRVKISIPKGRYYPAFEYVDEIKSLEDDVARARDPKSSLTDSSSRRVNAKPRIVHVALAALAACLIVSFFIFGPSTQTWVVNTDDEINAEAATGSAIIVTQFENQTGDAHYDFLESALQQKTTDDLTRFFSPEEAVYFPGSIEEALTQKDVSFDFALSAIIFSVEPEVDLFYKLYSKETGAVIFDKRVQRPTETTETSTYYEFLSEIVAEVSANAQERITLNRRKRVLAELNTGKADISKLDPLECVALANPALNNRDPISYKQVTTCLKKFIEDPVAPPDATVLSYYGVLLFEGSRNPAFEARSFNPDISAEDGLDFMKRAVEVDPQNATAQYFLSEAYNVLSEKDLALTHARLGNVANPASNGIRVVLSHREAANGNWDYALSLVDTALNRNANPRGHYYRTAFAWAILNDDKESLDRLALEIKETNYYFSDVFLFLAATANDDMKTMDALRPSVIKLATENFNLNTEDSFSLLHWVALNGEEELFLKAQDLFVRGGVIAQTGDIIIESEQ